MLTHDPTTVDRSLYEQLRSLSARILHGGGALTLRPTELVHEAWSKLASAEGASYADRQHFIAVCARAMRQVLIDHVRGKATQRRGGGMQRVTLSGLAGDGRELDLVTFSEALDDLERVDPRAADVVTLRVLGGLTVPEVALELGVSPRTVDNLWRFSLAFFVDRLSG